MPEQFYKVVTPNLASFHDPDFTYQIGKTVRRRNTGTPELCTDTVLHASRQAPHAARYGRWPYRLLLVEGVPVVEQDDKCGFRQLRVIREADVGLCFGPSGDAVVDVLRTVDAASDEQMGRLAAARVAAWDAAENAAWDAAWGEARAAAWDAARDAAWDAAWNAAWNAAWDAARDAARDAAGDAAWDAARAAARAAGRAAVLADLVGQHGLKQHHIETLMGSYVEVFGRPDWMGAE